MALEAPEFYAKDRAAWRAWLSENHETQTSVWLVYDKGEHRTMSWADIVQEALCFGWIDSRPGKISDRLSKIYISKRKPRSVWSRVNKNHVKELIAKNIMMPAGLEAIRIAQDNGSWDALTLSDNLVLPPELILLFDDNAIAKKNFDAFSDSSKRIALQWVYSAKTEQTRSKRIAEVVRLATENKKANQ